MKVYVVTELTNSYDEKFLDIFKKRPEAISFIQQRYPSIEKMENNNSKTKVAYRAVFPPGATGEWIKSVNYLFIIEKDI